MNILTDILSLFKRKQFIESARDEDVLVLGINEAPEIEGIASPVPYKNVKLIKVKDFINFSHCEHINVPIGSPYAGIFRDKTTDPITGECYINLRRLKSLSLNLTITENGDYIDFDCTAEANTGSNLGAGAQVFKSKVGVDFQFRTLLSSDGTISVTQNADDIDLVVVPSKLPHGKWSIANADGIKTYYDYLTDAMTAAVSGETIMLETDVTETIDITVTLKDGVDVDLGGHQYKVIPVSGIINLFEDNNVQTRNNFYNGEIIRNHATVEGTKTAGLCFYIDNGDSEIDFNKSVKVINENGHGIRNEGKMFQAHALGSLSGIVLDYQYELYDSIGKCTDAASTVGNGIMQDVLGTGTKNVVIDGCKGYGTTGPGIEILGQGIASYLYGNSVADYGISMTGMYAQNIEGYGVNYGVYAQSCELTGITGVNVGASGSYGLYIGNCFSSSNLTGIGNGVGIHVEITIPSVFGGAPVIYQGLNGKVTNGVGGKITMNNTDDYIILQDCNFNSLHQDINAHALEIVAPDDTNLDIMRGSFSVKGHNAFCLYAAIPTIVKYGNCAFNHETPADPPISANITQGIINTQDNQGNIFIS